MISLPSYIIIFLAVFFGLTTYFVSRWKHFRYPVFLGFLGAIFYPILLSVISYTEKLNHEQKVKVFRTGLIRSTILLPLIIIIFFLGETFRSSPSLGALYAKTFKLIFMDIPLFIEGNIVHFHDKTLIVNGSGAPLGAMIIIAIILSAFISNNWAKNTFYCILFSIPLALIVDYSRIIGLALDVVRPSEVAFGELYQVLYFILLILLYLFAAYLAYCSYRGERISKK